MFALVLTANDNEKLLPFFIWNGGHLAHSALPEGYSVEASGKTITVSRNTGTTYLVYRYDFHWDDK